MSQTTPPPVPGGVPPVTGGTATLPPTQPGVIPPGGGQYVQPPPPPPPPGPPPGSRMGRGKTIGLIVGSIVAVGALGGIGWAVFGGQDDAPGVVSPTTPGGGILQPTPTTTGGPTTSPTDGPTTSPTGPTTPTTTTPPVNGGTVQIGQLQIPLVGTWSVRGQGDSGNTALLVDGLGSLLFLEVGSTDPANDAASQAANVAQRALSADNGYSQVTLKDPVALAPGSLASFGEVDYTAVWSDAQGSFEVEGFFLVAIRVDGNAMIVWLEGSPPGTLNTNEGSWRPQIQAALDALTGAA